MLRLADVFIENAELSCSFRIQAFFAAITFVSSSNMFLQQKKGDAYAVPGCRNVQIGCFGDKHLIAEGFNKHRDRFDKLVILK